MSIFHIALAIYGGLTLIGILVGMSVCVVAGRGDARREVPCKRSVRIPAVENSAPNLSGKKWVLSSPKLF